MVFIIMSQLMSNISTTGFEVGLLKLLKINMILVTVTCGFLSSRLYKYYIYAL